MATEEEAAEIADGERDAKGEWTSCFIPSAKK